MAGKQPDRVRRIILMKCETESEVISAAGLAKNAGELLLPFRCPRTGEMLARSAEYLGINAERITRSDRSMVPGAADSADGAGVPPDRVRVAGRPVVLALGESAVPLAALFGRLAGRAVVVCRDGRERDGREAVLKRLADARSVTVAPPARWKLSELVAFQDSCRAAGCTAPVGYLYPFGEFEREFFALKAVLFGSCYRGRGRYLFRYPLEVRQSAFQAGDADVVIGRGESASSAAMSLGTPSDFMFVTPHSNGVSMNFGSLVLCAREDQPPDAPVPARSVPCFAGAACSRKRPDNLLLAATAVHCAIAFLYTCQGVLLDDGIYDVATSLAARFAASPYTAVLLTTPGMALLDRAAGPYVADQIRASVPLGRASAEFNRRHAGRYGDTKDVTVLFGDPEFTVPSAGGCEGRRLSPDLAAHPEFAAFAAATGLRWYDDTGTGAGPAPATPARVPGRRHAYDGVDYARCVAAGSRAVAHPALKAPAGLLAQRAEELWATLLLADARTARSEAASTPIRLAADRRKQVGALQDAWLEYFQALVQTLGGYVRLQTDRYFETMARPRATRACPYCRGPAQEVVMRLAGPGPGRWRRRLVECVACATILDALAPVRRAVLHFPGTAYPGSAVPLRIDLRCTPAEADCPVAALAALEPFTKGSGEPLATTSVWDRLPSRSPSLSLAPDPVKIPENLTPGIYFIDAIVLVDAAPAVLRRSLTVMR